MEVSRACRQVGQGRDLVGEDRAAGAPSRGPAVHARCEVEVALAPPRTAGLCRVRGLEMFNACMSGSTSSLEVLQSHLGGARGPDAVDVLAEALLSSLPQPAAHVPAYEAWPLVSAGVTDVRGRAVIRALCGRFGRLAGPAVVV